MRIKYTNRYLQEVEIPVSHFIKDVQDTKAKVLVGRLVDALAEAGILNAEAVLKISSDCWVKEEYGAELLPDEPDEPPEVPEPFIPQESRKERELAEYEARLRDILLSPFQGVESDDPTPEDRE